MRRPWVRVQQVGDAHPELVPPLCVRLLPCQDVVYGCEQARSACAPPSRGVLGILGGQILHWVLGHSGRLSEADPVQLQAGGNSVPEGNLLGMLLPAARKVSSARPPPWWSFLPGFGAVPGRGEAPRGQRGRGRRGRAGSRASSAGIWGRRIEQNKALELLKATARFQHGGGRILKRELAGLRGVMEARMPSSAQANQARKPAQMRNVKMRALKELKVLAESPRPVLSILKIKRFCNSKKISLRAATGGGSAARARSCRGSVWQSQGGT